MAEVEEGERKAGRWTPVDAPPLFNNIKVSNSLCTIGATAQKVPFRTRKGKQGVFAHFFYREVGA